MISSPRTLVCSCRFDVNLYRYQKVFVKKYTSKHCKLIRKNNFDGLLLTESLSCTMNVHSPKRKIRNMVLLSTFGLLLIFFVLNLFISLVCVSSENYSIIYL